MQAWRRGGEGCSPELYRVKYRARPGSAGSGWFNPPRIPPGHFFGAWIVLVWSLGRSSWVLGGPGATGGPWRTLQFVRLMISNRNMCKGDKGKFAKDQLPMNQKRWKYIYKIGQSPILIGKVARSEFTRSSRGSLVPPGCSQERFWSPRGGRWGLDATTKPWLGKHGDPPRPRRRNDRT